MKAVYLRWAGCEDGCVFALPAFADGSMDKFVQYLQERYNSYVTLKKYSDVNCNPPYFIAEETEDVTFSVSGIEKIREVEITVLEKAEYIRRLEKVIAEKCVHCRSYDDEDDIAHMDSFSINLDGYCPSFDPKDEDEE